jgi:hypothetical protein
MRNLDRLFVCGVVLTLCAELINNGYTSLLHCPAVEVIFSLGSSEISLKYTFHRALFKKSDWFDIIVESCQYPPICLICIQRKLLRTKFV